MEIKLLINQLIINQEDFFFFLTLPTYFTQLTLASVVDGSAIGHAHQVIQGVHAGGKVGVA